jgi:hypothetical protein
MTFQPAQPKKRKDDELLITSIVMFIFLGTLICVSFFYSSWDAMGWWFKKVIQLCYFVNISMSAVVFIEWQDPNFDKYRKYVCYLSVALILAIGIHHATVREDNQVIIDSKENAAKP